MLYRRFFVLLLILGLVPAAGCDSGGMTEEPPQENPDPNDGNSDDPDPNAGSLTITLLGQHNPSATITNADIWGYVDPSTGTEYALMGRWNQPGLYIYDLSDPSAPRRAATVGDVPGFDVKVWQQYAYTVTGSGDAPDAPQGRIIDLSDPANPQVVGEFPSSHNIFIDERGLMYSEVPGLRIFDLRDDPTNPVLLWDDGFPQDGHDATVVGDRLYDFHGTVGTRIYDVSDPANPQRLGAITHPNLFFHHSGWPTEDGKYLFICDESASGDTPDITVWNIERLEAPELVATITDPMATVHNLYIVGDLAYVSHYTAGFRVYDVSDPENPVLAAEYDTAPAEAGDGFRGAWGAYPFAPSGNIYVSDIGNGLFVFDALTD